MVQPNHHIRNIALHLVTPLVAGAATASVGQFGSRFIAMGSVAPWHAGLFGFLQCAVAHLLCEKMRVTGIPLVDFGIFHVLTGSCLFGASLVAAHVGLVAVMTLTAAATLILTTTIISLLGYISAEGIAGCVPEKRKATT